MMPWVLFEISLGHLLVLLEIDSLFSNRLAFFMRSTCHVFWIVLILLSGLPRLLQLLFQIREFLNQLLIFPRQLSSQRILSPSSTRLPAMVSRIFSL